LSKTAEGVMRSEETLPASRRPSRWVLALLLALAVVWSVLAWWRDRSYRSAIVEIELEMANGRYGTAVRGLNSLLEREPDSDEAALLLGRCEKERGRFDAAAAALARVAPGSPFSHQALLARMRLAHDQGEFAAAEELINEAARDPRNDGPHLRFLLVPIYSQLGRLDEAERLIECWWQRLVETGDGASERAMDLVRMHIELAFKPNPVKDVRDYLDPASRMAPADDRIWLGRANLAIRTGDYKEAERLLDACLEQRPEDAAVWRARLRFGMASGRAGVAAQAVKRLPADFMSRAEVHRVNAWLAARRGDLESERRELERAVAAGPADAADFDRLAELERAAGSLDKAARFTHEKAEFERMLGRYLKLYDRVQPIRDAVEMAQLAERLGRRFEARVFLTLAISADPERADLRRDLERLNRSAETVAETVCFNLRQTPRANRPGDQACAPTSNGSL
jgi:enediyne biosynthesis protein E4